MHTNSRAKSTFKNLDFDQKRKRQKLGQNKNQKERKQETILHLSEEKRLSVDLKERTFSHVGGGKRMRVAISY